MRFVDTSVFYSRSEKVAVRKEQDIVAGIAFPENPETFGKFILSPQGCLYEEKFKSILKQIVSVADQLFPGEELASGLNKGIDHFIARYFTKHRQAHRDQQEIVLDPGEYELYPFNLKVRVSASESCH